MIVRQCVDAPVDLFHHPHHLPRGELGALLVFGEVELGERLALLPDVTEPAADAERARKVAHHADDLHHRRRLGNDFDVDERVGWKMAGSLGGERGRADREREGKNRGV